MPIIILQTILKPVNPKLQGIIWFGMVSCQVVGYDGWHREMLIKIAPGVIFHHLVRSKSSPNDEGCSAPPPMSSKSRSLTLQQVYSQEPWGCGRVEFLEVKAFTLVANVLISRMRGAMIIRRRSKQATVSLISPRQFWVTNWSKRVGRSSQASLKAESSSSMTDRSWFGSSLVQTYSRAL